MIRYFALFAGIVLLLAGSAYYKFADWDIGISLLMAGFTFLSAEWSLGVVLTRQWRYLPLAVFASWWACDGVYWAYWSLVNPDALQLRGAAFPANVMLYLLCGVIFTEARKLDLHLSLRNPDASLPKTDDSVSA